MDEVHSWSLALTHDMHHFITSYHTKFWHHKHCVAFILRPLLAREFGLVILVFFINFTNSAIGSLGQIKVNHKDRYKHYSSKEPKASRQAGCCSSGKDRSNNGSPKPVGEGCETGGLSTLAQWKRFRANHCCREGNVEIGGENEEHVEGTKTPPRIYACTYPIQ
jgi:hypothetical protein